MIPIGDQIAEVAREVALRRKVYPSFIARRAMTQADADRHSERMVAALRTLEWLREHEASIREWLEQRKTEARDGNISGRSGSGSEADRGGGRGTAGGDIPERVGTEGS